MCGIFCLLNDQNTENFNLLTHRGPDNSTLLEVDGVIFGFHRLAILDTSTKGNQPFVEDDIVLICNGEIFNYKKLIKDFSLECSSESDCEVIVHLYRKFGIKKTLELLDGEFAFVLLDRITGELWVARDPFGVRPAFLGYNIEKDNLDKLIRFGISSEMKALSSFNECDQIPGGTFSCIDIKTMEFKSSSFFNLANPSEYTFPNQISKSVLMKYIHKYLFRAVEKRMMSDVPIGSFLSGGLDSSIITSMAYSLNKNLQCFTIGLKGSVDVEYAKKLAEYIKIPSSQHHIVEFDLEEGFDAIQEVIYHTETFDVTTIRASVPQYLLAKYIRQNTNVRVLLSGEGADELFAGYIYSKSAPSAEALRRDTKRLLSELMYFDNLRTDRTTASAGLEVRAPFLDKYLTQVMMHVDPEINMCADKIEKSILREAVQFKRLIPTSILTRGKQAFSDAVSSREQSWYMSVVSVIENLITDEEFEAQRTEYSSPRPLTKEALYYRKIFESYFPNRDHTIPHYWMPKWQPENVKDPSATILSVYTED